MLGGLAQDRTHRLIRAKQTNGSGCLGLVEKHHATYGGLLLTTDN